MISPYLSLALAQERQQQLLTEADRWRARKEAAGLARRTERKADRRRRRVDWRLWIPRRYVEC
jgi:hypothetical protein